jgi:hypothetical protein
MILRTEPTTSNGRPGWMSRAVHPPKFQQTTEVFRISTYFVAFFEAAHRFFCAAAMRALPSGLMVRFETTGLGGETFFGLPGPRLTLDRRKHSREVVIGKRS